jgi:hypothetical protein
MPDTEKKITAFVWRPGKEPKVEEIGSGLESFQEIVGGYIQGIKLTDEFYLFCNEEGRLEGLPYCCYCQKGGRLVGTIFVTRTKGEESVSLQEGDVDQIRSLFLH